MVQPKRLLLCVSAVMLLMLLHLVFGVLTTANSGFPWLPSHSLITYPLEVVVTTDGNIDATGLRPSRLSPRGIYNSITLVSADPTQTVWREPRSYTHELVILNDPIVKKHVKSITVRNGPYQTALTWEDLVFSDRSQSEGGRYAYLVLPSPRGDSEIRSLIAQFQPMMNYRGDVRVVFAAFAAAVLWLFGASLVRQGLSAEVHDRVQSTLLLGFIGATAANVILLSPAVSWRLPSLVLTAALVTNGPITWSSLALIVVNVVRFRNGIADVNREPACNDRRAVYPALLGLSLVALLLRAWNLSYFQGVDSFNITAGLSLFQNGTTPYVRNMDISQLVSYMFGVFGVSLTSARLPFALIGAITCIPLYLFAAQLHRTVAWVATALFAVSPVAIEKASHVREYSLILFLTLTLSALIVWVYRKKHTSPVPCTILMVLVFGVAAALVFQHRVMFNVPTLLVVLQPNAILVAVLSGFSFWRVKKWRVFTAIVLVGSLVIGFSLLHRLSPFSARVVFQRTLLDTYLYPRADFVSQWFAYRDLPLLLPTVVLLIPLATGWRYSTVYKSLFIVFWLSLTLFVFRMDQAIIQTRYVYHLLGYFIILFSLGLAVIVRVIRSTIPDSRLGMIAATLFLLAVISPRNTIHAVNKDLNRYDGFQRTTSISTDNRLFAVAEFLTDELGVTDADAILLSSQNSDLLSWALARPISRSFVRLGPTYQSGRNIYFINTPQDMIRSELDQALETHTRGFFVAWNAYHPEQYFGDRDAAYRYLGTIQGHGIYHWCTDSSALD